MNYREFLREASKLGYERAISGGINLVEVEGRFVFVRRPREAVFRYTDSTSQRFLEFQCKRVKTVDLEILLDEMRKAIIDIENEVQA